MAGGGRDRDPGAHTPDPAAWQDPFARRDPPVLELTLWPHCSLGPRGASWALGLTAGGLGLPLLPLAGSKVAWGIMPFLVAMLLGLYCALRRNHVDRRLVEELRLWPDLITVERREARGVVRRWHANPFWVQLGLFENARIEKYLTLRGNGREVELGAFLTPPERERLHGELAAALAALRAGLGRA